MFLAAFCSAALAALARMEQSGWEGIELDDEQQVKEQSPSSRIAETIAWWRPRRRAISLVLAMGHRLGIAAAVVGAVLLVGRFAQLSTAGLVVTILVAALVVVAICDVIPQSIARARPRQFAVGALQMVRLPYLLLYPLVRVLLALRSATIAAFGAEDPDGDSEVPTEEQIALRQLLQRRGSASERRRLLRSVTEFSATTVREVMVPRTDMVTISRDMDLEQILVILLECGHSRLPVYGESRDDIVGLFYAKDLIRLMASGREFDIEEFLREPYFVPETKPISELLTEFQRERIHLAVVVDEFGGTEGLITLEDIIEEIFGDIQDEYDVEPSQLVELSPTSVLADARIGIDEIEEHFDVELPRNGEYDSLGGFLLDQTGGVPAAGDELHWESLLFRVVEADQKRIDTVEIKTDTDASEQTAELVS